MRFTTVIVAAFAALASAYPQDKGAAFYNCIEACDKEYATATGNVNKAATECQLKCWKKLDGHHHHHHHHHTPTPGVVGPMPTWDPSLTTPAGGWGNPGGPYQPWGTPTPTPTPGTPTPTPGADYLSAGRFHLW